jgi:hypothetical protein
MQNKIALCVLLSLCCAVAMAADKPADGDQPALTIYNQNFAVVRHGITLDLKSGINRVRFTDATAHIEPDSVMLRDPSGRPLQVLEQNYRNDPVSQELLLSLFEGQTIDFLVRDQNKSEIVKGKIIRSGYVPHWLAISRYGAQYYQAQMSYAGGGAGQPIIEVGGKLQFQLPGLPQFPALTDNTILKPTLDWLIQVDQPVSSTGELSYITGGMSWHADYNVVAPSQGDKLDLIGWVTIDNQSGRDFREARIKLMAGDVNKIQPQEARDMLYNAAGTIGRLERAPAVSEKTFDEYHLYSLQRSSTLHDRETKQVEFVRATGINSQRIYVYDGAKIDLNRYGYYTPDQIRNDQGYGTESNPKIWVMQEFKNSKANNLGMPLPAGRLRFYRRDADGGQVEFTGENLIDHTPSDETVRVYTGNAFDIVGERRRTNFRIDETRHVLDESFEITLRNHKKIPVEVRVLERLYRCVNWDLTAKSHAFRKLDSQKIEFPVRVPADGQQVVSYTVHYTW